ncbi:hypothetical protein [Streptomyces sp. 2A115]|uniref:hypothetical protein n=1 Tax=Streptomyces sp. 2A115 TaxID=3457439 RepID=UPI003FD3909A
MVAANARREGAHVLRASGVRFEADIGYAGLDQLVLPLLDSLNSFDRLEPGHRDTCASASESAAARSQPPSDVHRGLDAAVPDRG